jgi:hypothetical protein
VPALALPTVLWATVLLPTVLVPIVLLAALLLVTGCGNGDQNHEITQTRMVAKRGEKLNVQDPERFGYRRRGGQHGNSKPNYTYAVPPGWSKLGTQTFRDVNLKVGEVECYVSTVTGGGLAANVNRWRHQMSLPDYSAEELAALPRRKMLGRDGVLVELAGTFAGRGGATKPGYKMRAIYVELPAFAVSVKMIGPAAAVDGAGQGFEQFVASLKIDTSGGGQGATGGHGAAGGFDRSRLRWDAPAAWQQASGSAMRVVTLKVPGKAAGQVAAECWVIDLGGSAGGVVNNINRWRGELQKPPLSAEDVDRLPRIDVLGQPSPLLEEEGSYQGMGGPKVEKAVLFGVVCSLPDVTVFIKMVGEAEAMRAAKNDFLKFCASLRIES